MKIDFLQNTYRYNPLNFSGRSEVNARVENFTHDLLGLPDRDIIDLKCVEAVAQKHIPGISIEKYKNRSAINNGTYALCRTDCDGKDGRFDLDTVKTKLYISEFDINGPFDPIEYVSSIVHEMTHAFQHEDKDISYLVLNNRFLDKHSIPYFLHNEMLYKKVFLIDKYIDALHRVLERDKYPCVTESGAVFQKDIKRLLPDKEMLQKFFEEKIARDISRLKKRKTRFNWDFQSEYMKSKSLDECDAYSQEEKVFSEYTEELDLNAILHRYIFENLIEAVNKTKARKIC